MTVIFEVNFIQCLSHRFIPGYHSIKTKRIVVLSNKTVNNETLFFENHLIESDVNNENNFINARKAFAGGMDIDGQLLYICRVRVDNETIPGKFSQLFNKCCVTYNNKELKYKRYQLLVDSSLGSYQWIQVRRPVIHLPPNIVLGGIGVSGQFYYIGQCRVQSQRMKRISEQIGKVQYDQSMKQWIATVPFSGQEIQCYDYSVLIMV